MPHKKASKKRRRASKADAVADAKPADAASKKQRKASVDEPAAAPVKDVAATGSDAGAGAGAGAGGTVVVRGMSMVSKQPAPVKYINKQRVLVLSSRGVTSRFRHLMEDLRNMIPHHKKDAKLDSKDDLSAINEVAEMKRCNTCVFFEARKNKDLFLWVSKTPNGPSAKCHVSNVHTMDELRMTGNCLRGSRPILSFDSNFDTQPHLKVMKEMFCHTFGTPRGHPKSQPFNDHIMSFYYLDGKIWVRHYQIADVATDKTTKSRVLRAGEEPTVLVEIGPRFVLEVIRVFAGSFGGPTLYQNGDYVSPNQARHQRRVAMGERFGNRQQQRKATITRRVERVLPQDELAAVFK